jgi:hypothetical protein
MSTDANRELLITGKQFNLLNEAGNYRQNQEYIALCNKLQFEQGITIFSKTQDSLTQAQIIQNLPNLTLENDALLSFVDNPMSSDLNHLTALIRKGLKSPPVFDGDLPHYASSGITSKSYLENNTNSAELFAALEYYGEAAEANREILIADLGGDIEKAKQHGVDMLGECSPYLVIGHCLIIGKNGEIFHDITEIPHVSVVDKLPVRIASGDAVGAAMGWCQYDTAFLMAVVKDYRAHLAAECNDTPPKKGSPKVR